MTDHRLEKIVREEGETRVRFHFRCSCSVEGMDHGAKPRDLWLEALARRKAFDEHKRHAEGKSPTEVDNSHRFSDGGAL